MEKIKKIYMDWFNQGNKVVNVFITLSGLLVLIPMLPVIFIVKLVGFLHGSNEDLQFAKYLKLVIRLSLFVLFFVCCLLNEISKNKVVFTPQNVRLMFYVAIVYFFIIPVLSCKIFKIYDSFKEAWVEQVSILLLLIVLYKHYLLLRLPAPTYNDYLDVISWACTFAGMFSLLKL
jgi:hypothetical protein